MRMRRRRIALFRFLLCILIFIKASTANDCTKCSYAKSVQLPESCKSHLNYSIPVISEASSKWSIFTFGGVTNKRDRINYGFGYCSVRNRFIQSTQSNVGPTNVGLRNTGYRNIGSNNFGPNNYGDDNRGANNCGNGNRGTNIEGNYLISSEYEELREKLPSSIPPTSSVFFIQTPSTATIDNLPYYFSFRLVDLYCPGDSFAIFLGRASSLAQVEAWNPIGSLQSTIESTTVCEDSNYAILTNGTITQPQAEYQSLTLPLSTVNATYLMLNWTGSVLGYSGGTAALKWTIKSLKLPRSCDYRRNRTVPVDPAKADGFSWGIFVWGTYTLDSQANFGPTADESTQTNPNSEFNLGADNVGDSNMGYSNKGTRNFGSFNMGIRCCGVGNTGNLIYGNYLTSEFYEANWEPLTNGNSLENVFSIKTDATSGYELKIELVDLWCPGDTYQVFYGFSPDSTTILLGTTTANNASSDCSLPIRDAQIAWNDSRFSKASLSLTLPPQLAVNSTIRTVYIRVTPLSRVTDGGSGAIRFMLAKIMTTLPACETRTTQTAPLSLAVGDFRTWNTFVWGNYAFQSRVNFGPIRADGPNQGAHNYGSGNSGDFNVGYRNIGDYNFGSDNRGDMNCGTGNAGSGILGNYLTSEQFANQSLALPGPFSTTIISVEAADDPDCSGNWLANFTIVDLHCPGDVYRIFRSSTLEPSNSTSWQRVGLTSSVRSGVVCDASTYTSDPEVALARPELFSNRTFSFTSPSRRIVLRVERSSGPFQGGTFALKYTIQALYAEPTSMPESCALLDHQTIPILPRIHNNRWLRLPFGSLNESSSPTARRNTLFVSPIAARNNTLTGNIGDNNAGYANLGSWNQGNKNFGWWNVGDGNCGENCVGSGLAGFNLNPRLAADFVEVRNNSGPSRRVFSIIFSAEFFGINQQITAQVVDLLCNGDSFGVSFSSDLSTLMVQNVQRTRSVKKVACRAPNYTYEPDEAWSLSTIYSQGTFTSTFMPTSTNNRIYFVVDASTPSGVSAGTFATKFTFRSLSRAEKRAKKKK